HCYLDPRSLHSFPTRRSSDLIGAILQGQCVFTACYFYLQRALLKKLIDRSHVTSILDEDRLFDRLDLLIVDIGVCFLVSERLRLDRKSTRLNSSHVSISYAVF